MDTCAATHRPGLGSIKLDVDQTHHCWSGYPPAGGRQL